MIAQSTTQFVPRGLLARTGKLMIHAMAQYIFYNGKMWAYDKLLEELNRGVHFAILPDGQIVQHGNIRDMLWHAKGYNTQYAGVELLVPGVYDLDALHRKIDRFVTPAFHVYPREQYNSLIDLQGYLASYHFIQNPITDWALHSDRSQGRKRDPGSAFSVEHWKEKLNGAFI